MSEAQQPTPDEVQVTASQNAKNILHQGVTRHPKTGEVLDTRGLDLRRGAAIGALSERGWAKKQSDLEKRDAEYNRRYFEAESSYLEALNTGNQDAAKKYDDEMDRIDDESEAEDLDGKLNDVKMKRDANAWRAHRYKEDNKAGFETVAIEDANAAGHDINYGGHHFPAQNPEQQPLQGEQSAEQQPPEPQNQ